MTLKDMLEGIFDENTKEYEIINECYNLITTDIPVTSAQARVHMINLDRSRTDLSTMYFMLCRNISKKKEVHQKSYDAQYARLVKLGRPSNAAIEAEIRANDPAYSGLCSEIEALEQVKELISSYIRCIDANKKTTSEILMDSRRVD